MYVHWQSFILGLVLLLFNPGTPTGLTEACNLCHRESLERSEDKNCTKWGSYMQDKGDQLAEAAAEGLRGWLLVEGLAFC